MASLFDVLRTSLLRFDKVQRVAIATVGVCVFMFLTHRSRPLSASNQASPMQPCSVVEPAFDESNDMESVKEFGDALRRLLQEGRYADLNCIADAERSNKELVRWKVHEFYLALTELPGNVSPDDRESNLKQIQSWVDATPESITARVALAHVYVNYAWDARGVGTSDRVSENETVPKYPHDRLPRRLAVAAFRWTNPRSIP